MFTKIPVSRLTFGCRDFIVTKFILIVWSGPNRLTNRLLAQELLT